MSTRLSQEQPPFGTDPSLAEWLTRQFRNVGNAISLTDDMEETGQMPEYVYNGMRRYFNQAILPDITEPGAWIYEEGQWVKQGIANTGLVNRITVNGNVTISDDELSSSKVNIILVQVSGITITMPVTSGNKLIWFQKDYAGAGTYDVVTP